SLRTEVGQSFRALNELQRERAALESDSRERARMIDLYRFEAEEIKAAELVPGDEEELKTEERRLSNATRLADTANQCLEFSQTTQEGWASMAKLLESAVAVDPKIGPLTEWWSNTGYEFDEAMREFSRYRDSIEHDPARLEEVQQRLDLIGRLKRKYGETI